MRTMLGLMFGFGLLAGCSSSEVIVAHNVDLRSADTLVDESQLLDVGVVVFDSGVPEGEVDHKLLEELIDQGTFVQIRRAEALYFAVELRDTLQNSQLWGGVWITPRETSSADVNVKAKILQSDGEVVAVAVEAVDAEGRTWLDKEYSVEIAAGAYNRDRYAGLDAYQDLFNLIANDLAVALHDRSAEELARIREVASLRYAAELSPDAFSSYLTQDDHGVYELNRLPARDDPQFDRTQRARQRERLFLETLDQHYVNFAREAQPSYDDWREYSREETIQVREITRSSRFRTGMGIATILASFVYGNNSNSNSFSDRVVRDTLMYVGMDMLRTSASRRQEKQLHVEALEELSSSFDDEVEPLVVEVQGTAHRLTGTAEVQYQSWKDLLRELYMTETGLAPATDMEIYLDETEALPAGAETPQAEPAPADAGGATTASGESTEEPAPADSAPASGEDDTDVATGGLASGA
jgi:hypothetical protein